MKKLIVIGTAVVQVLLILSAVVPGTKEWWSHLAAGEALGAQLTFIGAHLTLVTIAIGLLFADGASDRELFERRLLERVPGAMAKKMRDEEFYSAFTAAMKSARHSVNICYFSLKAPDQTYDQARRAYYEALPDLIKMHPQVRFRRLTRRSDANMDWLADQIELFKGVPNIALAYITEPSEERSMGLALSTQVIDEEHVWLVAIESHERETEFRDVYIQSATLGVAFGKYFQRLWAQSCVVLEWGDVTPGGEAVLERRGGQDATPA